FNFLRPGFGPSRFRSRFRRYGACEALALPCRCACQATKGHKQRNRQGAPSRTKKSQQNAAREREPRLLVASPALGHLSARQTVALYARRMQIECPSATSSRTVMVMLLRKV